MAADPILTQATTFSIDNSAGTPVTINGIQSMSGLGSGQASEIDVTTLASTSKEFLMGLQDNGSFSISFIWNNDDLGQQEMLDARANQSAREFIVTLPTSTNNVGTFNVLVLSMGPTGIESDGVAQGEANLRISGDIVWS